MSSIIDIFESTVDICGYHVDGRGLVRSFVVEQLSINERKDLDDPEDSNIQAVLSLSFVLRFELYLLYSYQIRVLVSLREFVRPIAYEVECCKLVLILFLLILMLVSAVFHHNFASS